MRSNILYIYPVASGRCGQSLLRLHHVQFSLVQSDMRHIRIVKYCVWQQTTQPRNHCLMNNNINNGAPNTTITCNQKSDASPRLNAHKPFLRLQCIDDEELDFEGIYDENMHVWLRGSRNQFKTIRVWTKHVYSISQIQGMVDIEWIKINGNKTSLYRIMRQDSGDNSINASPCMIQ